MAALKFVTLSNLETFLSKLRENLSGSKLSESGKFVTSITQTNGKVSAEFAQINASDVHVDSSTTLDSKLSTIESAIESAASESEVTVEALGTPTSGFLKSYVVKQNGVQVGATIDIPKDFLVKSGTVEGEGSQAKIVLVLNTKDESDTDGGKVEIPVGSLVDEYTAGNGIDVTSRVVSVKKDNASENFLDVTEAGVKVSGIQTAIDSAKNELNTKIESIEEDLEELLGEGEGSVSDQIETALDKLDLTTVGEEGKFIQTVSQNNGQLSATAVSFSEVFVACQTSEIEGLFA